jgi:hypothetical protein
MLSFMHMGPKGGFSSSKPWFARMVAVMSRVQALAFGIHSAI